MINSELLHGLLLFIPPFIICLCFHEYAHAWVADRLGDSTARYMGRLTLDPMAHMSWLGTVIFPAIGFLTGAPLFGWANPVPVDSRNFKNPRRGMAVVAAAGPISNFVMALICTAALAGLLRFNGLGPLSYDPTGVAGNVLIKLPGMLGAAIQMLSMGVLLNLFLGFFNLIPIPPLDGSRIVQAFVSHRASEAMDRHAGVAQLVLFVLIFTELGRYLALPVFIVLNMLFHAFAVVA